MEEIKNYEEHIVAGYLHDERSIHFDAVYMKMAYAVATLSRAIRHKVGAIIVSKDGQVVSQGFNGTPQGSSNVCEEYVYEDTGEPVTLSFINPDSEQNEKTIMMLVEERIAKGEVKAVLKTKKNVLHAESNAITKCAKWGSSTDGATLYVTMSPCIECSKLIIQSGIQRVVFCETYRDNEGIRMIGNAGILVEQIDRETVEKYFE